MRTDPLGEFESLALRHDGVGYRPQGGSVNFYLRLSRVRTTSDRQLAVAGRRIGQRFPLPRRNHSSNQRLFPLPAINRPAPPKINTPLTIGETLSS
jgi:hypothetical protein